MAPTRNRRLNGSGPTLAVIVPGLDAAATLPRCLDAINAAGPVDELLFFDDGSSDGGGAIAAARGARVLRNDGPPIGPGLARTRAAAATGCDLLLFVDADVAIHPDAPTLLRSALEEGQVAAFGSYDDSPSAPGIASRYANLRHHFVHQNGETEAGTFWAGLGIVRRDAFLAAGGFSTAYTRPSIEDIELGARLIAAGGRIRLVPAAQGTHLKRWTLGQLWRTDVFRRAIPWARLIATRRSSATGLNGTVAEGRAAAWAWLTAACLAAAPASPWTVAAAAAAATGYVWQNRRFFSFLRGHMARTALAGAVVLHWFYHLYASAILGVALVAARLRR